MLPAQCVNIWTYAHLHEWRRYNANNCGVCTAFWVRTLRACQTSQVLDSQLPNWTTVRPRAASSTATRWSKALASATPTMSLFGIVSRVGIQGWSWPTTVRLKHVWQLGSFTPSKGSGQCITCSQATTQWNAWLTLTRPFLILVEHDPSEGKAI